MNFHLIIWATESEIQFSDIQFRNIYISRLN